MRQLQLLWSLDNGHILITDCGLCNIYAREDLSLLHSHSCTDQHCKCDSHHLVVSTVVLELNCIGILEELQL